MTDRHLILIFYYFHYYIFFFHTRIHIFICMFKNNFDDNGIRDNIVERGKKIQQEILISSLHTLLITQFKFFTKFFINPLENGTLKRVLTF